MEAGAGRGEAVVTDWEAFFQLHGGLDRQGPGTPEDVAWALAAARTPPGARIFDAGCGAGVDLPAPRFLTREAWEAYYGPLPVRIGALRPGAETERADILDAAEAEIDGWRRHGDSFTYALLVGRPE